MTNRNHKRAFSKWTIRGLFSLLLAFAAIAYSKNASHEGGDVLFTEDFENGINPNFKPIISEGSAVEVDSAFSRSGNNSLKVTSAAKGKNSAWLTLREPVFPIENGSFYLRAYVYYPESNHYDNVYLFQIKGTLAGDQGTAHANLGPEGNPYNKPDSPSFKKIPTLIYHSKVKSATHKVARATESPELPYGRWVCWEWHVDAVNHIWEAWIDGTKTLHREWSGNPANPWQTFKMERLSIGVRHPHEKAAAFNVWFDDIVISDARVGP